MPTQLPVGHKTRVLMSDEGEAERHAHSFYERPVSEVIGFCTMTPGQRNDDDQTHASAHGEARSPPRSLGDLAGQPGYSFPTFTALGSTLGVSLAARISRARSSSRSRRCPTIKPMVPTMTPNTITAAAIAAWTPPARPSEPTTPSPTTRSRAPAF